MGSPCALHLYVADGHQVAEVLHAVAAEVLRLEAKYSSYLESSVASRINHSSALPQGIELDDETVALLDYAAALWQQSGGLFDITSGVLRKVWNFKSGRLPTQAQLDSILPCIGWQKVKWRAPNLTLPQPGMEIDFGGYVKEYGADCAAAKARALGVQHGLVELGGDIRVIGPHPDGRAWDIGVRHPDQPDRVLARIKLNQGAVTSSGDYERYILHAGKRYGHILNPFTGWPVEGLKSVTVLADHCLLAGSACTVALLKGNDADIWLEELGLPWLAVDQHGQVKGPIAANVDNPFIGVG